jgi:hypothetical protein
MIPKFNDIYQICFFSLIIVSGEGYIVAFTKGLTCINYMIVEFTPSIALFYTHLPWFME